jgi:peptidyl-dipeptidase Dcp
MTMVIGRVVARTFLAYALRGSKSVAAFAVLPLYAATSARGASGMSSSSSSSSSNRRTSLLTKQGDRDDTCLAATAVNVEKGEATPPLAANTNNPLLGDWSGEPFRLPPFGSIEPSHFPDALREGMRMHIIDLNAIVAIPLKEANFENTIATYDRAGNLLHRVNSVFSNLCNSKNTDELQAVQTEMTPVLSRHESACYQLPGLFERIQHVYDNRLWHDEQNPSLSGEQVRLVERIHLDFTRKGAGLAKELQAELADLEAELASLSTAFQQNVMKDEETYELVLHLQDLSG